MLELLGGQFRKLKRHGSERHETVRRFRADGFQPGILQVDDPADEVALRCIPIRIDGEHLHVDAVGIHVC